MRQGVPLLEAIQQTSHLRAREPEAQKEKRQEGMSPPNMAALGDMSRWNEMK